MGVNRGKDFEKVIKEAFEKVPGVSIDRLHDQMNGFAGSANISDFIVYKYPHEYYIECKSVHGNTFPLSNISKNQWQGMLEKSEVDGVIAGVVCWWIDKDVTKFIPIQTLESLRRMNCKSIRFDDNYDQERVQHLVDKGYIQCGLDCDIIDIPGKKKRVFFDYNMDEFMRILNITYNMKHQPEIPRRVRTWRE